MDNLHISILSFNMKKFLLFYFLCVCIGGLILSMNYGIVCFSGEMRSYDDVVAAQQNDKSILYGCVFNNDYIPYKTKLYDAIMPETLVVGSSRVLYYSQSFFNNRFANCGLAINNIHTAKRFFRHLDVESCPKTIIIGLDHWWFNEGVNDSPVLDYLSTGDEVTIEKMFLPIWYLYKDKFSLAKISNSYFSLNDHDGLNEKPLGLRAIELGGGFYHDGSSKGGTDLLVGRNEMLSFKTAGMKLIKGQPTAYEYVTQLRKETVDQFFSELDRFRKNGVKIIVFFSPLFPEYYNYLKNRREYSYIPKLIEYTREKYGVYSYINPDTLGLTDSDFYDLIHIRRAAAAKLLLDISGKEPDLRRIINYEHLEKTIEAKPLR